MGFSNLIKVAIRALLRNRMRALLTMLGIIIGVASVIAMLSLGEGTKQGITKEMGKMGTNLIMVMPNYQQRGGVSLGSGTSMAIKMSDVDALRKEDKLLAAVSPEVRANGQVIFGNKNTLTTIYGVSQEYFYIRNLKIQYGRIFNDSELKAMSKVCVLGQTVVENLFSHGVNPVGLTIRIKNMPFQIIGVLEDKGESSMGQDQDDAIICPYTTVQRRLISIDYIHGIYASAKSEAVGHEAAVKMDEVLRRTHKLNKTEEADFTIMSQSELLNTMGQITNILTILLGAIASISLLVGGIGIMNIMLVSVTERTREIGLRMSVGSRRQDIMKQFLVESIILSLLGGIIGITIGWLIGRAVSAFTIMTVAMSANSVMLAFIVCTVIGVFFGWYPASKAAKLNPIDALRYE
jgi:putative ABC transport system permease protein